MNTPKLVPSKASMKLVLNKETLRAIDNNLAGQIQGGQLPNSNPNTCGVLCCFPR